MPKLSDRVGTFTDSVIRRMTRISNKYGAINLSQGFPDFDPPAELTEELIRIAKEGPHQYSITYGAENFRAALAEKHGRTIGRTIDPETEVVATCGGTEAMMCAMMTVCNPGDKVMIFSPFYENYGADTILSGAEPIYIPLVPPDYHFDPELLEAGFRVHSFFDDEKMLNCLLSSQTQVPEETVESVCRTVRNEIKFYFGQRLAMGIGSVVASPAQIGVSARQARTALQHCIRKNGIHPDSEFSAFSRDTSCKMGFKRFDGAVGGSVFAGIDRVFGADKYHVASDALLLHLPERRTGNKEVACSENIHIQVPFLQSRFIDRISGSKACIVDDDVHAAVCQGCKVEGCLNLLLARNIHLHCQGTE